VFSVNGFSGKRFDGIGAFGGFGGGLRVVLQHRGGIVRARDCESGMGGDGVSNPWLKKSIDQSVLDSLQRRVTPSEAEGDNMVDGVAFGHIHDKWVEFKEQLLEGDELRHFRTPDETWETIFPRCGLEGYAIIRDGALVTMIVTGIS
jgi:hypothetical protein